MADEKITIDPQVSQSIAALTDQVRALVSKKDEPAKTEPKVWSRTELDTAVAGGKITQAQADAILTSQTEKTVRETARAEARDEIHTATLSAKVDAEIDAYKDLVPDVMKSGSDARKAVEAEYQELISLGDPATKVTELKAMRTALGKLSALKAAANAREEREHHEDGGSSGDDDVANPSVWKGIPARNRTFYQTQINKGIYKGVDDPKLKRELDHIRANPRRRAA